MHRVGLWILVLVTAILAATPPLPAWGQVAQNACVVQFGPDMANLEAAIGEAMGQPLDCEHHIDSTGEMVQATSTGTAWYRSSDSAAEFTDGYHRWELGRDGLVYWSSPDATPLLMDGLPDGPAVWQIAVTCPVLYTHEVPAASAFRRFLAGLLQAGYQPTSFADVDAAMAGWGGAPNGCVVLSFDDALASQLRNAVPVLAEFHVTALFFVMPSFQDGRHQYLDAAGIRALRDAGHIVGAHTCNHATLTLLSSVPMMAELSDCKHQIENIIGAPVRYVAYPNGAVNQAVLAATAEAGYRAAFTTRASATLRPDQPYLLPRFRYDPGEPVSRVVQRLHASR
jgi:peptidoglycan/xylan/chitin deacetylase (PgdA/CDA1 family)